MTEPTPFVQPEIPSAAAPSTAAAPRFHRDMTVGEAMRVHTAVSEVFAAFHLGGCSHCGISAHETIGQIAMGYGIDEAMLLGALEDLFKS